jgi:uncharacterized C2H2 Zn-finger protein
MTKRKNKLYTVPTQSTKLKMSEEEWFNITFDELTIQKSILILPITDSEKLLISGIKDSCRFDQDFKYNRDIKHICESIGWEKSKGERVYRKLKKLKLITKDDKINSDTLLELTMVAIMKRREQEAEKP